MYLTAVRICAGAIALGLASSAPANPAKGVAGSYVGEGRQCFGQLLIRARTIEWKTPFAECKRSSYKIIKNTLATRNPEIVFELTGPACGFGVIALGWNAEYPDNWNATGYRSLPDYVNHSDDKLICDLRKVGK